LVNVRGELMGINTAIATGGGGNQGVGFAVPADMARTVMDELRKHGKVTRGWLGVSIQPMTPDLAKAFGLPGPPRGALVGNVTDKSPAARSGIQKGDIIIELNDSPIAESQELRLKVSLMPPGSSAKLKVFRDHQEHVLTVTLGELPANGNGEKAPAEPAAQQPRLGVSVTEVSPQIARQLSLPSDVKGVVVTNVAVGSAAEEAGIQRGDVIEEVNRKPVLTVDQFQRAIRDASPSVVLLINRAGNPVYAVIPSR
jgi:serine protease Do